MNEPYLLLWLEGPLQAWGNDSKFSVRDTLNFPTKSGLLGLLCCALGAGGEQHALLAELADLDLQIIAYCKGKKNDQGFLKPNPKEPLLRDFHMVGSGYDDKDPWQKLCIPKKSDGKPPNNTSGTKLTYRYYLQDSAFAVAMQVPDNKRERFINALINPVWDIYLGRKCCVPTEFVFQGDFPTSDLAFAKAHTLADQKNYIAQFKVLQGEHEGDAVITLNDVPIRFGSQKRYRDRQVTINHLMQ